MVFSVLVSCTSARWTVKEKTATDTSEYKVLQQDYFLMPAEEVSPENPILTLDLLSKTTYQYPQRVLLQRNIQDYKVRPGFLMLGMAGAATAFYLANSDVFRGNATSTKSWTLNAAGVLLTTVAFLNMKPVGEARPTGEERYLRSTGDTVKVETVDIQSLQNALASVEVQYQDQVIFTDQSRRFPAGKLEIPIGTILNNLQLSGPEPGNVSIRVAFKDSTYAYDYPIRKILQPYARVTAQLTELRSSPDETSDNVLADLLKGSQVQIQNSEDEAWYQVLYGISKSYIRKEDAQLIWRPAGFADESEVVTVPNIPFGNIDVESNIPILRGPVPNALALIITNENYTGDLPRRNYAHRDGRLMQTYLQNALGYSQQKVFRLLDLTSTSQLESTISKMKAAANDSTELFVFLSGYGAVNTAGNEHRLNLLGISEEEDTPPTIDLRNLFGQLANISLAKTVILSDVDFSKTINAERFSTNEEQRIIEYNTEPLDTDSQAVLVMGTQLNYPSSLYVSSSGEDKKHHIFPYFFAKTLQRRITHLSGIYQYLERNVTYTARKLHDRPQEPLLLGNTTLDLASE